MSRLIPTKKHHYFLLYLILLLPFLIGIAYFIGFNKQAFAAVTFDNGSAPPGGNTDPTSPRSWQHTVGSSCSNSILIVGASNSTLLGTPTVTFDGQAFTMYKSVSYGNKLSFFYLLSPHAGQHTLTVKDAGGGILTGAASYCNVDQTNPFGPDIETSGNINSGQKIDSTVTVNGTTANQFVVDTAGFFIYQPSSDPSSVGSGQTRSWFNTFTNQDGGVSYIYNGGSSKPASDGSTAMTFTSNTNYTAGRQGSSWGHIAVALNPAIPLPTTTPPITATITPNTTQSPTLTVNPNPTSSPTQNPTSGGNIVNLNFGISNAALLGQVVNLNFGISNTSPWMQIVCGDIRMDNGITNSLPPGQTMSTINSSCTNPGIIFTGDTTPNFGQGQASSTNQVVGGSTYPEVYTPGSQGIFSAYAYLVAKAQGSSSGVTDLATICTLSNCTLPPNLPHGIYKANGNVTLNAYTFPANSSYVFLINGDLTLNGNVLTPAGTNSSTLLAASGNIVIPTTVGSAPTTTTANLSGIFTTDKSFIMQSTGNCNDLRLNIEGSLIVNAGLTGGTLQNNRDLCGNDATSPTLQLTQRLDFVLNLPDFIKEQSITSAEVAP